MPAASEPIVVNTGPPFVAAHLDPGEAAVLGLALERGITLVAIDEKLAEALREAGE